MAPAQSRPEPTSGSLPVRFARAARALTGDDRLAALGAGGLLVSLALPWYQKTYAATVDGRLQQVSAHLSALGAFTLVEGAVMLIALAVLVLMFLKAERGKLSLPGRDGTVILAAGGWSLALVLFRVFDQPAAGGATTVGIAWGIFVALGAAGALTTAGMRTRSASVPEAPIVRPGSNRDTRRARSGEDAPLPIEERSESDPSSARTERLVVGGRGARGPHDRVRDAAAPTDGAASEPRAPGDRW